MTSQPPATPGAIESEYERLARDRADLVARLERRHAAIGLMRLAIAGVALVILITTGLQQAPALAACAGAFLVIAVFHARLLTRRAAAAAAVAFYQQGLRRIRHTWAGTGRRGDEYRPTSHIYADDLDLFGASSLFELLATTRTRAGEETLARWLLNPADAGTMRQRQAAVQELAKRVDLRERLATIGDQVRTAVDAPILRQWAAQPVVLAGRALQAGLFALAAVTSGLVVYWLSTDRLGTTALVALLVQSAVAWWLQTRVQRVMASVEAPAHDLTVLAELLTILERERFTSEYLAALTARLSRTHPASHEIHTLARHVAMLSSRRNVLFALPAAVMLWGTQWAVVIERWRARVGSDIPHWLENVGEFEALSALGGFAAEHPDYAFPDIVDGPPVFEARDLAHVALGATPIPNDLALSRSALSLLVVSGSNMSGKSTWLRTIGTTMVVANLGAPVRASWCRLSPMAIGAAIRVTDSLADGQSRFFAEIKRLKAVLDLARDRQGSLLFLLDEILAGTNSHDRQVGADALVRSLLEAGAIGLITTHDLAIGDIAETLAPRAANVHFADRFENGSLEFDYRMRPGVVRTRNALALMRSIGIGV